MIIIPLVIISIIVIIELYLHFCYNKDSFKNQTNFQTSDIWTKVEHDKETRQNKYHVIIHDFEENKFKQWNEIIPELEYDLKTKEVMILSKDEIKAIAILNLIISNMQNNISINDIIEKDLINKSILKARKFKMVETKLIELIKENNKKELPFNDIEDIETIDTSKLNINENKTDNDIETNIETTIDEDKRIKPEEYNYDGFSNKHHKIFKVTSSQQATAKINNKLHGYSGAQYASPF